uniref:Uncharacterized protein n=1 Tax=Setaria digitata TaxID=48799 RepID=A0A915Q6Z9_9BILA
MFARPPFLRYPLWRLTFFLLVGSTAISSLILMKLRQQENMRRKKWEEFYKVKVTLQLKSELSFVVCIKYYTAKIICSSDETAKFTLKNYDPYKHIKEICSHSPGIMHSCPKDLALAYEKAGLKN